MVEFYKGEILMKNFKKILASLLVVVMVLTAAPLSGFVGLELPDFDFGIRASALSSSGSCGENVTYTYDSVTKELVISGEGPMYYYGYSSSPFYNSDIKDVVIEEGVTTIGCYTFENCNSLTNVTLPDSMTEIDFNVFYNCPNFAELTIGMNEIPSSCFANLTSLKKVTLLESVETIGDYAFSGCTYLETINIPDSVTFVGAEILKNTAWYNYCGKGLVVLDGWAYGYKGSDKNITITFDETVKGIAKDTFKSQSNIVAFDVAENNSIYLSENGVLFNKYKTKLIAYPCGKTDSEYIVPDTIEIISGDAFYSNDYIDRVIISDKVTIIGDCAFYDCVDLDSITIGKNVTTIGKYVFYGTYNLRNIIIEGDIKTIGENAFYHENMDYTIRVYISNLINWFNIDFESASSNPLYNLAGGSELYINGIMATDIIIPDTIIEIKPYTFYDCRNLKSVTISNNVTNIGKYAFSDCRDLTNITISDSVTTIGAYAFNNCNDLISITLNKNLKVIGKYAFGNCSKLKDVYYPGSQAEWNSISKENGNDSLLNASLFLMHNHDYAATTIKKVTCTENGEILYTCKLGDSFIEVVPALGHNWVDLGGSVKATCTTEGVDNYKCSNCGEEKKGTTSAFGHDWEYIEHTYATCDKDGYMSRVCLREGCNVKEEEITPAAHNLDWWDTKEPTCTEPGAKYIGCLDCSYSFAEAIPANGHTYYWDTIKNATCTTEGLKEKRCEECGVTFATEVIPVNGHTYSEWFELLPATCSERGLNIKICDDCNDIQRQIIPKIAHIDADGNGVCDNCESTYKSDAADTPEEPDIPEPDTPDEPDVPDEPEEKPCDCNCHAGGIKAFFFNFLNFFAKLFNKDARTCECGAAH